MEYTVLSATSTVKLGMLVNGFLKQGWQVQGGASLAVDQGRYEYVQAMIKESK